MNSQLLMLSRGPLSTKNKEFFRRFFETNKTDLSLFLYNLPCHLQARILCEHSTLHPVLTTTILENLSSASLSSWMSITSLPWPVLNDIKIFEAAGYNESNVDRTIEQKLQSSRDLHDLIKSSVATKLFKKITNLSICHRTYLYYGYFHGHEIASFDEEFLRYLNELSYSSYHSNQFIAEFYLYPLCAWVFFKVRAKTINWHEQQRLSENSSELEHLITQVESTFLIKPLLAKVMEQSLGDELLPWLAWQRYNDYFLEISSVQKDLHPRTAADITAFSCLIENYEILSLLFDNFTNCRDHILQALILHNHKELAQQFFTKWLEQTDGILESNFMGTLGTLLKEHPATFIWFFEKVQLTPRDYHELAIIALECANEECFLDIAFRLPLQIKNYARIAQLIEAALNGQSTLNLLIVLELCAGKIPAALLYRCIMSSLDFDHEDLTILLLSASLLTNQAVEHIIEKSISLKRYKVCFFLFDRLQAKSHDHMLTSLLNYGEVEQLVEYLKHKGGIDEHSQRVIKNHHFKKGFAPSEKIIRTLAESNHGQQLLTILLEKTDNIRTNRLIIEVLSSSQIPIPKNILTEFMCAAASTNYFEGIITSAKAGCSLFVTSQLGVSPFDLIVAYGHYDFFKKVLEFFEKNFNEQSNFSALLEAPMPFIEAAYNSNIESLKQFIIENIDLFLIKAAQNNDLEKFTYCLNTDRSLLEPYPNLNRISNLLKKMQLSREKKFLLQLLHQDDLNRLLDLCVVSADFENALSCMQAGGWVYLGNKAFDLETIINKLCNHNLNFATNHLLLDRETNCLYFYEHHPGTMFFITRWFENYKQKQEIDKDFERICEHYFELSEYSLMNQLEDRYQKAFLAFIFQPQYIELQKNLLEKITQRLNKESKWFNFLGSAKHNHLLHLKKQLAALVTRKEQFE